MRTQRRELVLGRSLYEFMRKLGLDDRSGGVNAERTRLKNQMTRLFNCSVQLVHSTKDHQVTVSSFIADRTEYWWDTSGNLESTVLVGFHDPTWREILSRDPRSPGSDRPERAARPQAVRRSASTCICGSPYRTFALKRPLCLSWRQLYRQFGADPAQLEKRGFTINRFRAACLRELKKINPAWPDLNYHTVTGGLVVSPSPPRIPPSAQLRLISE